MKLFMIAFSCMFAIFFFMHEFDAAYLGEWRMMGFLSGLKERTRYLIFLYVHIPFCMILFYYLWSVSKNINLPFLVLINSLGILHLLVHLAANTWKTNVFTMFTSFLFIWGIAITGVINLLLLVYSCIRG
ncbi:MAG: hypothetical protein N2484_14935 [Clostridia bacterium]|nr:hypothetical protein [Clostridia bacterium]